MSGLRVSEFAVDTQICKASSCGIPIARLRDFGLGVEYAHVSSAEEPTPDKLQRLAESVWLFPFDSDSEKVQPSVGIVCTKNQTVLIDCGNGSSHARRILTALAQIAAPPIRYAIYTHHHWDHVFGASAFDVPIIGHALCREHLLKSASEPWGAKYLQQEIEKNPKLKISYTAIGNAIDDWTMFRIVPPEITFSQKMELHLDDLTIELEHVGGSHAADSIVVRVKESGVIFLGDCFYVPPLAERTRESKMAWGLLESLIDNSIDLYVDSHSKPATRQEVVNYLAQVNKLNQAPA